MIDVLHIRHLYFHKQDHINLFHIKSPSIKNTHIKLFAIPPYSVLLSIQFESRTLSRTPAGLNQPHALTSPASAGCKQVMGGNGAETESLSGR